MSNCNAQHREQTGGHADCRDGRENLHVEKRKRDADRERVRSVGDEARVGLLLDLRGPDALRVERRRGEEEGEE